MNSHHLVLILRSGRRSGSDSQISRDDGNSIAPPPPIRQIIEFQYPPSVILSQGVVYRDIRCPDGQSLVLKNIRTHCPCNSRTVPDLKLSISRPLNGRQRSQQFHIKTSKWILLPRLFTYCSLARETYKNTRQKDQIKYLYFELK
jgi:hypothetical protein